MRRSKNGAGGFKIPGSRALFLLILSVILGIGYIYFTTKYPRLKENNGLIGLMTLLYITPLFLTICSSIPITLPIMIDKPVYKLCFSLILFVFGVVSVLFTYYFVYGKPILVDPINHKLTGLFFYIIPFLFSTFGFLLLANTLLKFSFKYKYGAVISLVLMAFSRGAFFVACIYLLQTLLTIFRLNLSS